MSAETFPCGKCAQCAQANYRGCLYPRGCVCDETGPCVEHESEEDTLPAEGFGELPRLIAAVQPPPRPGGVAVWPSLLASGLVPASLRPLCEARDALGRSRYGRPLEVGNGRDAARDCLEELLDAIAYSGQHAMETAPGSFDSEEWECVRQVVRLASRVHRMMEERGK